MKSPERVIREDKGIFQVKINGDTYVVDEFFYRKVKRIRNSMGNMEQTIRKYTERIKVKKKYLNEIYADIKGRFKKQIKK